MLSDQKPSFRVLFREGIYSLWISQIFLREIHYSFCSGEGEDEGEALHLM